MPEELNLEQEHTYAEIESPAVTQAYDQFRFELKAHSIADSNGRYYNHLLLCRTRESSEGRLQGQE